MAGLKNGTLAKGHGQWVKQALILLPARQDGPEVSSFTAR